jgi:hypothetical protein
MRVKLIQAPTPATRRDEIADLPEATVGTDDDGLRIAVETVVGKQEVAALVGVEMHLARIVAYPEAPSIE